MSSSPTCTTPLHLIESVGFCRSTDCVWDIVAYKSVTQCYALRTCYSAWALLLHQWQALYFIQVFYTSPFHSHPQVITSYWLVEVNRGMINCDSHTHSEDELQAKRKKYKVVVTSSYWIPENSIGWSEKFVCLFVCFFFLSHSLVSRDWLS